MPKYRISIDGFDVRRETKDDSNLEWDGKRDEVFIWADSRVVDAAGNQIIAPSKRLSQVIGDTFRNTYRVQGGSASDRGGLMTGDAFPKLFPWIRDADLQPDRPPMLLFEGELTNEQGVVCTPAIIEFDDLPAVLTAIKNAVDGFAAGVGADSINKFLQTAGGLGDLAGVPVVRIVGGVFSMLERLTGQPKDRPIGLVRNGDQYSWPSQTLVFNERAAEAQLGIDYGYGPGVFTLEYKDADDLGGHYLLYLRLERVGTPSPPQASPRRVGLGDHFYTISEVERQSALQTGHVLDGSNFTSAGAGGVECYVRSDIGSHGGDHFYTTVEEEREKAKARHAAGYREEQIACYVYEDAAASALVARRLRQFRGGRLSDEGVLIDGEVPPMPRRTAPVVGGTVPLFRLIHITNGDHFYTINEHERDAAVSDGHYVSEGVACRVYLDAGSGRVALYRSCSLATGDHFYTVAQVEHANAVQNLGYRDEGVACYVHADQAPGTVPLFRLVNPPIQSVPLYRLCNTETGDHFYCVQEDERAAVLRDRRWRDEHSEGYVFSREVPGTVPLYRLYRSNGVIDHFYCVSSAESDMAQSQGAYEFERVECWVYDRNLPSTVPLYRLLKLA